MKMNMLFLLAGLLLVSSLVLQGCFQGAPRQNVGEDEDTAKCEDGKFTCSSKNEKWCAEQRKKCNFPTSKLSAADCTPKCTWQCETKECDQVCAPKCNQAVCSTRCKGFNTDSCQMKCGQPNCKVVCPKHSCPNGNCAACKTECGKPVCQMQCKKDEQPCRHMCAQPICSWDCKKPDVCPKPKCSMKCEKPRSCLDNTRIVQQLPPLEAGETEVSNALTAPSSNIPPAVSKSLLSSFTSVIHGNAATMRVDILTMDKNLSVQARQVDLQLAPMEPLQISLASWAVSVRRQNGKQVESKASCKSGALLCEGDAAWCKQQKMSFCKGVQQASESAEAVESEVTAEAAESALLSQEEMTVVAPAGALEVAFLRQRSGSQSHLQP